ncbi:MAG: tetratricopeptide repeat protein [Cyanobacteria bacterium J06649_12]
MPVSAEVLLQAGATETKLVTADAYRPMRHRLTAEAGQTVAIKLKLANNNPAIVSRVVVYAAGKRTPLVVDNQASYRVVDPTQKSKISHLIVLTLPDAHAGEQGDVPVTYEIEPLFDYDAEPLFALGTNNLEAAEEVTVAEDVLAAPSTVRYRMTVETATVSQRLLLEAQARQAEQDYEGAIATYTRAISLNPDIADFYAQRGRAYVALGEQVDGISTVQQAIVTDWETAAQLYERVGHGNAASALRSQLQQVVETAD